MAEYNGFFGSCFWFSFAKLGNRDMFVASLTPIIDFFEVLVYLEFLEECLSIS